MSAPISNPVLDRVLFSTFGGDQPRDEHGRWVYLGGPHGRQYSAGDVRTAGSHEVPPELQRAATAWKESLSAWSVTSLHRYTGEDFELINAPMRTCPEDLKCLKGRTLGWAEAIDEAIRKFPQSDKPVTSWRSLRASTPTKQAQIVAALEAAHLSGGVVKMPGFGSASLDPAFAANRAVKGDKPVGVVLEIRSRRGAFIRSVSEMPEELEILHPHNDTYKVVEVQNRVQFHHADGIFAGHTHTVDKVFILEAVGDYPPPLSTLSDPKFSEFDPALHPHGEHGRWATVKGEESASVKPAMLERVIAPESKLEDALTAWAGKLTFSERSGIDQYTQHAYHSMNQALRNCPENWDCMSDEGRERAVAIDAAIRKFPTSAVPLTTYRGIASNRGGTDALPRLEKIEAGLKEALETGAVMTVNGFSSSTIDPSLAARWATAGKVFHGVVLEIKSKRGAYLGWLSNAPEELEVLHNHGERYKVTGVREQTYEGHVRNPGEVNSRTTYTLEAIDEEPPPPPAKSSGGVKSAAFGEFDPSKHPHGEHGHWASVTIPPSPAEPAAPVNPFNKVYSGGEPRLYEPDLIPPKLRADALAWSSSQPRETTMAISDYTQSQYQVINSELRKSPDLSEVTPSTLRKTQLIDDAIRAFPPHDPPLNSWRGLHTSDPEKLKSIESGLRAAYQSGGVVTLAGFSSASLNPNIAVGEEFSQGVVLELRSTRGAYIPFSSSHIDEREVLHPHNERFKVVGVHENVQLGHPEFGGTARVYVLEALPEPPPPLPRRISRGELAEIDRAALGFPTPKPADPTGVPFGFDESESRDDHGRWVGRGETAPQPDGPHKVFGDAETRPYKILSTDTRKANLELGKRANRWEYDMLPDENEAVGDYTIMGFQRLNSELTRAGGVVKDAPEDVQKTHAVLTRALAKFGPTDPPVTVWRGSQMRQERLKPFMESVQAALKNGGVIAMPCFQSTTFNPKVAFDSSRGTKPYTDYKGIDRQDLLLEIRARSGAWVGGTAHGAGEENEWLISPDARYRVTGIKDLWFEQEGERVKRSVVQLEEVPPPASETKVKATKKSNAKFQSNPGRVLDRVAFATFGGFNPDLHPHGEHGHWASRKEEDDEEEEEEPDKPPVYAPSYASDVSPALVQRADDWKSQLSSEEYTAIRQYTGIAYHTINKKLRGDSKDTVGPDDVERVQLLDTAIRKFGTHEPPLTSFRGLASTSVIRLNKIEAGLDAALASGGTVKVDGFQSASLNYVYAADWSAEANGDKGVVLEIRSPRCAYIENVSSNQGELEVLHLHGEAYRVTGVREQEYAKGASRYKMKTYTLEAQPESPPPPALVASPPEAEFDWDESKVHRDHGKFAKKDDGTHVELDPTVTFDPRKDFRDTDERPTGELKEQHMPAAIKDRAASLMKWSSYNVLKAIKLYTYDDYRPLNRALTATGGDVSKLPDTLMHPKSPPGPKNPTVKEMGQRMMEGVWAHGPNDPPLTCWRRMSIRHDRMAAFLGAVKAAQESGGVLQMPVFGSATMNPDFILIHSEPNEKHQSYVAPGVLSDNKDYYGDGLKQHIVLEIRSRSGVWVGGTNIPTYPSENEVIQPPTAKYKVLGWKEVKFGDQKRTVLQLDELSPDPALYADGPHDPKTNDHYAKMSAAEFAFNPAQPRSHGRWAASESLTPHVIPEDQFAKNPPNGFVYDANLPHEADTHSNPGKITVGPKFFAHSTDSRQHIITHEIGHDLSDKMLSDGSAFRLMSQGAYTSRVMGDDGRVRLATVHDRTPGENAAESYARLVHESDEFLNRFPHAHRATAEAALAYGFPVPAAALAHYPDLVEHSQAGTRPDRVPKPEEQLLHDVTDDRQSQLLSELVALNDLKYNHAKSQWELDGRTAATAKSLVEGPSGEKHKTLKEARKEWNSYKASLSPEQAASGERSIRQRELDVKYVAPWLASADFGFDPSLHPHGEHGKWASVKSQPQTEPNYKTYKSSDVRDVDPTEIPAHLIQASEKWVDSLTKGEKLAMRWYTEVGYKGVNKSLRKDPDPSHLAPATQTKAADLDAAIRKFPKHSPPVTVWRGLDCHSPEKQKKIEDGLKAALQGGATVQLGGFSSTSLLPIKAGAFTDPSDPVVLEIRTPHGAYIKPASLIKPEEELLLPNNVSCKVTGVQHNVRIRGMVSTFRVYQVEVADELPPPLPRPEEFSDGPTPSLAEWVGFEFNPDLHPRGEHGHWGSVPLEVRERVREVLSRGNLNYPPVDEQLGMPVPPEGREAVKARVRESAAKLGRKLTTAEVGAEIAFPGQGMHGERLKNFLHRGDPDSPAPPPLKLGEHPLEPLAAGVGGWVPGQQTDEEFRAAHGDVYDNMVQQMDRKSAALQSVLPHAGVQDLLALAGWQPGDEPPGIGASAKDKIVSLGISTRVAPGAPSLSKLAMVNITDTPQGLVLDMAEFNVGPQLQGKGEGTRSLAAMLSTAARLGFWRANTGAVGCGQKSHEASPGEKYKNGYYTWPMLGFDHEFAADELPHVAKLPEPFRDSKRVSDILSKPGGPAAWKAYGWGITCGLILTRDDTPGMRVLKSYLSAKRKPQ